jgi:hypothetical protein
MSPERQHAFAIDCEYDGQYNFDMPRIAADLHLPFPRLDKTGCIPLGLATLHAIHAQKDWRQRSLPDHWLQRVDHEAAGCSLPNAATFIWSLRTVRAWLSSPEQRKQYSLASKRVHFTPRILKRSRPMLARTPELYSLRGGQRIEALAALGFALACERRTHSLKCWRPLTEQIYRVGLTRKGPLTEANDAVERHFKILRSRLNTAYAEWGQERVRETAQNTFAAFYFSAFPKV